MARFSNVWCLVALLSLLVAATSAYRTVTTVEVLDDVVSTSSGRCKQEMQQAMQRLSSCRQYLREGHRYVELADENTEGWREHFPQCCNQLERINEQCRCQAIKQVAQSQVQGIQGMMEKQEMLKTAESLPSLCRIAPRTCKNIREQEGQEGRPEVESVF